MEAEDPLSQLRDIHLPDPVSFWPPAFGWWILLVLILAGLFWLYRTSIANIIRQRKLNTVLTELEMAYSIFQEKAAFEAHRNDAGLAWLAEVNTLLKRVAQVIYPHAGLGELTGQAWLQFLDACDNSDAFTKGPGAPLGDGVYRRTFDADPQALHNLVKNWIEARYSQHKDGAATGNRGRKESAGSAAA